MTRVQGIVGKETAATFTVRACRSYLYACACHVVMPAVAPIDAPFSNLPPKGCVSSRCTLRTWLWMYHAAYLPQSMVYNGCMH